MAQRFEVLAVNGQQIFKIIHGAFAMHEFALAFNDAPAAGTISVEYQRLGDDGWTAISHATLLALSDGYFRFRVDEPLQALRVTIASISGGSDGELWFSDVPVPSGLFNGLAAMVVQPYTEANVKNGVQFFARAAWPLATAITAGTTVKMHLVTGAKPLLIKIRELSYVAEELVLRLYANPTGVTGGTPITIKNYNLQTPQATTIVTALKDVTTVSNGTEIEPADPEYFFGGGAAGNRALAISPAGLERVIPPNSDLLVTIQNTGTGAARAQYFITWYEGAPDMPV